MKMFRLEYPKESHEELSEIFEGIGELKESVSILQIYSVDMKDNKHELKYPVGMLALAGGTLGTIAGFWFQYSLSVNSYPLNYGGKPYFSILSFIPVIFECAILGSVLSLFAGLLIQSRKNKRNTNTSQGVLIYEATQKSQLIIEKQLNSSEISGFSIKEI